ncbi:glycosyl hydrolase [Cellvibrio fontiphilus]|uniref:Glycosyl hydrolase n=1 Tax=Cellvibrio fontiphilus TaxID=1815559 RepID=A0ABV7FNA5_9GAMM
MNKKLFSILMLGAASGLFSATTNAQQSCSQTPADPDANLQAKNLLCYLKNNTYISGQTDMPDADKVQQWTGRYPAIVAFDFYRYTDGDTSETQKAIDFAKVRKGIVAFQWHWKCPRGGEYYTDCAFDQDMNNPNSKLYQDIDVVARELKKMGDAGVPVLFRPLHEANDNFMWWAKKGTDNYKRLWKLIYDRVNAQGVNNVLWVFNGMASTEGYRSNMRDWYPGDNMVDAVTSDYYQSWTDYNTLRAIGNNKILGIAETFNALNPATEPPFSFSVVWAFRDCYRTQGQPSSGDVKGCENSWRTAMASSRTISIDQLPDFNATNSSSSAGPINIAQGKTVSTTSVEGAGYEASRLVDGNSTTRWASALNAPSAAVTIDLGGYYDLTGARLQWEAAYATAYEIQVSTDNVNFSSAIFSKSNGVGGTENLSFLGQGRYLRINMTGKANPAWGYSLWEVSVFGESTTALSSSSAVSSTALSSSPASASAPSSSQASSSNSSAAPSQFTCTVTRTGNWTGGYQADVRVTNNGPAVSGWKVYLNFAQNAQITSAWNATFSGNGTTHVTAINVGYNGNLGAGASTSFGFTGNSGSGFTLPGCSGNPNN